MLIQIPLVFTSLEPLLHFHAPIIIQTTFTSGRATLPLLPYFSSLITKPLNLSSKLFNLCLLTFGLLIFFSTQQSTPVDSHQFSPKLPPCTFSAARPNIGFIAEFTNPFLPSINRDRSCQHSSRTLLTRGIHEHLLCVWKPSLTIRNTHDRGTTQHKQPTTHLTPCQITHNVLVIMA